MAEGGKLYYKCRMCGDIYSDTHAPDVQLCLVAIVTESYHLIEHWFGIPPMLLSLHSCKDGQKGVSDLIGGKND